MVVWTARISSLELGPGSYRPAAIVAAPPILVPRSMSHEAHPRTQGRSITNAAKNTNAERPIDATCQFLGTWNGEKRKTELPSTTTVARRR